MLSPQFKEWQAAESGIINQHLQRELALLPVSARPVASHILNAGGKRLRPLLVLLFARLLGYDEPGLPRLACSMEMLHAATLLHDDVLDNAHARRGKPAAHLVFNISSAILGGDALLAQGNAIVASFNNPRLVDCFSQATIQTAAGEIREMESLRNPELGLDTYCAIAKGKTAWLIACSCALGALAAGAEEELAHQCASFGENLGMAFQIVDDALDFAPQSQTGKPCGGDLREGKMTPPLYFYRNSLDSETKAVFDQAFASGLFEPGQLEEICAACAFFVPSSMELADSYLSAARETLKNLPDRPQKAILEQILDYVRQRSN